MGLKSYLVSFFKKTQPLIPWEKIEETTEEMFESEWDQGSLFGWEDTIQRIRGISLVDKDSNPLHCIACNKTFANENVF
jgi:splicing factor 3A subunit 3